MKKHNRRKVKSRIPYGKVFLLLLVGAVAGFWLGQVYAGCFNYSSLRDVYQYFKCPGINIEQQGIVEKPEKLEAKLETHEYNFSTNRFSASYDIYAGDDDIEKNINILVESFLQDMTIIMDIPGQREKVVAVLVYKRYFKKATDELIKFLIELKKHQNKQTEKKLNI